MNHITSLLRGIIRTHVVLGLTFTAAIIPLLAGNRPASDTAAAPTVRNVVLVHGAFADGSSWAKVIPLLESKGLHVTAVQNPLSSLADDVAATKRAIANQDGPVILVGHSWAGMVISEAGNDPKVAGLVYVAAIVPDEGQSANDVLKPYSPPPGLAEAKPDAAGFLSLSRKGIDENFVPDLPPAATTRQIRLTRRSPHYWRVTINRPPLNIFGPDTIPQLNDAITAIETDEQVKVVVFDSAIEGFFLTHYDFLAKIEDTTSLPPGPTGLQPLPDMLVRLSRAPVVSIASIRGRATGVGSELALACDMRFASREKAILSHFEVGAGIVPGGGPMARLPRLIGRGRALEVFLVADDFPGDLAERYGYVNRSLPDAELDEFVDSLANRIASFDKRVISETKRFVDVASLPPDYEIAPEWDVCFASIMRPAAQDRIKKLMEQGFHKPGDVENRLGYYVGQVGR